MTELAEITQERSGPWPKEKLDEHLIAHGCSALDSQCPCSWWEPIPERKTDDDES